MSVIVDNELVFVHLIKTGGMSIAKSLKNSFGSKAKRASELDGFDEHYRNNEPAAWAVQSNPDHCPARVLRDYMGPSYKAALSFAVVRNPWSLVVSIYNFVRQTPSHPGYFRLNGMSFDQYVDAGRKRWSQIDWISDGGSIVVDRVLRFENLADEFRCVMKEFDLPGELEKINTTKDVDYRTLYTDRTASIVGDRFQDDIKAFSYKF